MGKTILETYTIFPFSIVLALALGEAFKQTVSEKLDGAIQWDRIPALLTFLLLVLPFYQGMNRYLLQTYGTSGTKFSAVFLVLDGVAFMAESALFFAMSRNLPNSRWAYFYWIVLALLVVDTCWGFSAIQHASPAALATIGMWMKLNAAFSVALLLLMWLGTKVPDFAVAMLGMLAMLVRTIFDYRISWDFYFS